MNRVSDLGERALIRRMKRNLPKGRNVVQGIGDDAAVLSGSGNSYTLLACDMLVEGVHFNRSASAASIGWKGLAVNVSDIAAMGGVPQSAVISLGLPSRTPVSFVDRLYQGLRRCAARHRVTLVGGDTVRSRQLVVNVAILGTVEKKRLTLRSGARVGDVLLVTGRLGGAVSSGRHLKFQPRLQEARSIGRRFSIHAAIDLSDGLALDLSELCTASRVGAVLELEKIPRTRGVSWSRALSDGEDFELLIAVAKKESDQLLRWAKRNLSCPLTQIGRIVPKSSGVTLTKAGKPVMKAGKPVPLPKSGFRHF